VAVAWTLAFAWAGHVPVPLRTLLLVALVTWAVYVADRLLDAWRGLREPSHLKLRERHFFHWHRRRALLPLAIAAGCAAVGIFFSSAPMPRTSDSVLGAVAMVYFSGVHSRRPLLLRWPRAFPGKELLVGVLFTAGCALAAWDRTSRLAEWPLGITAAGYAGLAWLNCASIARWESRDTSPFFRVFALALAAVEILLSMFAAVPDPRSAALLAAAAMSALLLVLLDCARTRMTPLALRSVADFALLTPVPVLLLVWALR
jgi:hypothetical protein